MMRRFIEVRLQFPGLHCWPNAPEEVSFLRYSHRHIFHVRARMNVSHDDRELEFFIVKDRLEDFRERMLPLDLGSMSCEQIATKFAIFIQGELGRSYVEVEVSEDGENGSIVML